jgi:hypothetical protein
MNARPASEAGLFIVSSKSARPGACTPREVLQELVQLLVEYGPTWYTDTMHERAVAALAIEQNE